MRRNWVREISWLGGALVVWLGVVKVVAVVTGVGVWAVGGALVGLWVVVSVVGGLWVGRREVMTPPAPKNCAETWRNGE